MFGVGASSGIGIGKAIVFVEKPLTVQHINIHNTEMEIEKFNRALEKAELQLVEICKKNAYEA